MQERAKYKQVKYDFSEPVNAPYDLLNNLPDDVDPEDIRELRMHHDLLKDQVVIKNHRGRTIVRLNYEKFDDPFLNVWAIIIANAKKINSADLLGDLRDTYCGGRF